MMRKILHFASPEKHYICDAAIVWCYDNRFESTHRKLLKRLSVLRSDSICIAGGAKSLVSPHVEGDRQFLLDQIRISIQLHGTQTVMLMLHSDCGAYGGLSAFKSAEEEALHHRADLRKATALLKEQFPDLTVRAFFVDFEGVWEVNTSGEESALKTRPRKYRYSAQARKVVQEYA